jgi:hypothetical protein
MCVLKSKRDKLDLAILAPDNNNITGLTGIATPDIRFLVPVPNEFSFLVPKYQTIEQTATDENLGSPIYKNVTDVGLMLMPEVSLTFNLLVMIV